MKQYRAQVESFKQKNGRKSHDTVAFESSLKLEWICFSARIIFSNKNSVEIDTNFKTSSFFTKFLRSYLFREN